MKMIEILIKYLKLSDGVFDIILGFIIDLWGIGIDNERVFFDEEIKVKLLLVGCDKISINEEESSVMF